MRCLQYTAIMVLSVILLGCGENEGKPYGSGIFGKWIEDEFGLHAYRYTLPLNDPRAYYEVNDIGHIFPKRRNDHWHLLGNDRTLARCFNDGALEVIAPFSTFVSLNYHSPEKGLLSGGFGELSVDGRTLSTRYHGENRPERVFGMGYCYKKIEKDGMEVKQYSFSPWGRSPVILTLTDIELGKGKVGFYTEYWEAAPVAFIPFTDENERVRASSSLEMSWEKVIIPEGEVIVFKYTGSSYEIPLIFAGNLSGVHSEIDVLEKGIKAEIRLKFSLSSAKDEQKEYCTIFGFAENTEEVESLAKTYVLRCEEELNRYVENIKTLAPLFRSEYDWLEREIKWDYYYLLAGLISGGEGTHRKTSGFQSYSYVMGIGYSTGFARNSPAPGRDISQHAIALSLYAPELAKEMLEYVLMQIPKDLSILYWHIPGIITPSDYSLFLMWAVAEYVLATRDFEFLESVIPYYDGGEGTVWEHLLKTYEYLLSNVGTGPHGLLKIKGGDWNDALVFASGLVEGAGWKEVIEEGESTLNTAMAAYILPYFAELAFAIGENEVADELLQKGKEFCDILESQWTGRWYTRAILGNGVSSVQGNVVGIDRLYLEPQPWAIVSGCTERAGHTQVLIESIFNESLSLSQIGAPLINRPVGHGIGGDRWEGHDGGVWPLINGWLIWALSEYAPELAVDVFLRNTLARHAEVYPDVWVGIWSAFDSYNMPLSRRPGYTWSQHPFYDMNIAPISHPDPHFSQLGALVKLLGISFKRDTLIINPAWRGDFMFKTPVLSFEVNDGEYYLVYTPPGGNGVEKQGSKDEFPVHIPLP